MHIYYKLSLKGRRHGDAQSIQGALSILSLSLTQLRYYTAKAQRVFLKVLFQDQGSYT